MEEISNYKKIIVVHPGKQHSFQMATALKNKQILYKYITTVYDKPKSLTNFIIKFLKGKNKKKAKGRKCDKLQDNDVIQYYELLGLINLYLPRIKILKKYSCSFNNFLNDIFAKKVAKYIINNNIDAVISYDYNSTKLFEILKNYAPSVKRILDVSIANRSFMKKIFLEDLKKCNEKEFYNENLDIWNEKNIDRAIKEVLYSNEFIVPSKVVKESIMSLGINEEVIHIIPYGVDCNKFKAISKDKSNKKLRLIYVGGISYRKGIHHLLNVISKFDPKKVDLTLIGNYDSKSRLYLDYNKKSNIHFEGFITSDILANKYNEADVFVFPTLCEGYGLVVLEALSSGLPVICSDHAGGNDAIIDNYNGFVFETGNESLLFEKINYFINNRESIEKMRANCRYVAENLTWEKYYENIGNCVLKILN